MGLILMEIKKGKKAGAGTIRSFMEDRKDKNMKGFVISLTEPPQVIDHNIYRVTPWMLLT